MFSLPLIYTRITLSLGFKLEIVFITQEKPLKKPKGRFTPEACKLFRNKEPCGHPARK